MTARFNSPYFAIVFADEISAITAASGYKVEVPSGHIGREIEVINTGATKLYLAVDQAPAANMQAVLPTGASYSGVFDEFTELYIKSSADGGAISVVIRGV